MNKNSVVSRARKAPVFFLASCSLLTRRASLAASIAVVFTVFAEAYATLFNPYVRSTLLDCDTGATCTPPGSAFAGGADAAIAAADDHQRKRYFAAAGHQYEFNSLMGVSRIGLSADAIYKGVANSSTSPNLPLTALAAGAAGIYGFDVWLHNKPAEAAYIVGFQAITCTLLRSRAILMTAAELKVFKENVATFEADIKNVDAQLSALQIDWDLGDEAKNVSKTEQSNLKRETGNVIKSLARARKLLLTARAYEKEVDSSGQTIRGQVDLVVSSVSGQLAPSEPDIGALKGLLGIFGDPSKGVADLQAVTLSPTATAVTPPSYQPAADASGVTKAEKKIALAADASAADTSFLNTKGYQERMTMRTDLWTQVSALYADGRKLNSVLGSAQNFYESTRHINACAPIGGAPPLQITPATVPDPVPPGSVLKFAVTGGLGIPEVTLTGSTGTPADAKTPDLSLSVNGNSLVATVTILTGATGTLTLQASDKGAPEKGTPAQQTKVAIDVESAPPSSAGKPTFKATSIDGAVQLTFATPSQKAGTLSGYTITLTQGDAAPVSLKFASPKQGSTSTGSASIAGTITAQTATDTMVEISGLSSDKSYAVGLTATFDGAPDVNFETAQVTPVGQKAAQKAAVSPKPKVTAADQSIQISFVTPAAPSGSTLSGYTVAVSGADAASLSLKFSSLAKDAKATGGTATINGSVVGLGTSTSLAITGLKNGTPYTVGVMANFQGGAADLAVVKAVKVTPAAATK